MVSSNITVLFWMRRSKSTSWKLSCRSASVRVWCGCGCHSVLSFMKATCTINQINQPINHQTEEADPEWCDEEEEKETRNDVSNTVFINQTETLHKMLFSFQSASRQVERPIKWVKLGETDFAGDCACADGTWYSEEQTSQISSKEQQQRRQKDSEEQDLLVFSIEEEVIATCLEESEEEEKGKKPNAKRKLQSEIQADARRERQNERVRRRTTTWWQTFCSRSSCESCLLIRGRKLVGSRRNVTERSWRKLFMPESSDSGLRTMNKDKQRMDGTNKNKDTKDRMAQTSHGHQQTNKSWKTREHSIEAIIIIHRSHQH